MIVRITDGEKILLAHNSRFPDGVYSCIAGYVEPGETLENTVLREIKEEVSCRQCLCIRPRKKKYYLRPLHAQAGIAAALPGGWVLTEPHFGAKSVNTNWYPMMWNKQKVNIRS